MSNNPWINPKHFQENDEYTYTNEFGKIKLTDEFSKQFELVWFDEDGNSEFLTKFFKQFRKTLP